MRGSAMTKEVYQRKSALVPLENIYFPLRQYQRNPLNSYPFLTSEGHCVQIISSLLASARLESLLLLTASVLKLLLLENEMFALARVIIWSHGRTMVNINRTKKESLGSWGHHWASEQTLTSTTAGLNCQLIFLIVLCHLKAGRWSWPGPQRQIKWANPNPHKGCTQSCFRWKVKTKLWI